MNLIESQAAIDAVYDAFSYAYCDNCEKELDEDLCGDCHRKYQNWSASKKTVEKVINALPSVQSEIIQCKDCKFSHMTINGECKYCDIWFPDEKCYMSGDYYCGSAERREE